MKELIQMEAALPGLYASAPQALPFAPSSDIRAFLLRREQGNLLVYSVTVLDSDTPAVQNLGGIAGGPGQRSALLPRERARVGR